MSLIADLIVRIGADTQAWGELKQTFTEVKGEMVELGETAKEVAEAFLAWEATKVFLEIVDQFEEATKTIVADTAEIGDTLETLKGQFSDLFSSVPESATEVAGALSTVTQRLHETGDEANAVTQTLLDLSTITGESATTLARDATAALNQWKVSTDEQVQELTNLRAISASAAEPLTQLLDEVTRFGPAMREMGLSLDQGAQLMANLDAEGVNSQRVFMALNTEATKLAKEGVPDVAAAMEDWVSKIKNAATDTDALAIASSAGARGAVALADAIRSGAVNFDDFTGKLKIANTSINDQVEAAKTLGDIWTGVFHALAASAPIDGIISVLKLAGTAIHDWIMQPLLSVELTWKLVEIAAVKSVEGMLVAMDKVTSLGSVHLFPTLKDDIANLDALQHNLTVDFDAMERGLKSVGDTATAVTPHIKDAVTPPPGAVGQVEAVGEAWTHIFKNEQQAADAAGAAMKAAFDVDFSATSDKGFEALIATLEKARQKILDTGDADGLLKFSFEAVNQTISKVKENFDAFLQNELALYGPAVDAIAAKSLELSDKMVASFNAMVAAAAKLGDTHPFDALSQAMKDLGVTQDGLTAKEEKDLKDVQVIMESQGSSLSAVEEAWQKVQGVISKMANDPAGLTRVVALQQEDLNILQQKGAPLQAQQQAYINMLATQLKFAESQGNSAQQVLLIGENLEIAKAKQSAFNEQMNAELDLFKAIGKEFTTAWTAFGNGVADAIVGAQSFGQAMKTVLDDMEKKLTELVVNYLLGKLKDAFIQNTNALEDFAKAFNAVFGSAGSVSSATGNLGSDGLPLLSGGTGSQQVLNSLDTGAGSVANGASQAGSTLASVGSGVLGMLSSITDMVTGIGSLISSIVQNFQMSHLISTMGKVEENTRRIDISFEGAGLKYMFDVVANTGDLIGDFRGWFHDAFASLMTTEEDSNQVLHQIAQTGAGGGGGGGSTGSATPASVPGPELPTSGGSTTATDTGFQNTGTSYAPSVETPTPSPAPTPTSPGPNPDTGVLGTPKYALINNAWAVVGVNSGVSFTPGPPQTELGALFNQNGGSGSDPAGQLWQNLINTIKQSTGVTVSGSADQYSLSGNDQNNAQAVQLVSQFLAQQTAALYPSNGGPSTGGATFTPSGQPTEWDTSGAFQQFTQEIKSALGVTVTGSAGGGFTMSGDANNFTAALQDISRLLAGQGDIFAQQLQLQQAQYTLANASAGSDMEALKQMVVIAQTAVDGKQVIAGASFTPINPVTGLPQVPSSALVPQMGLPSSVLSNQSGAPTTINVQINGGVANLNSANQLATMFGAAVRNVVRL